MSKLSNELSRIQRVLEVPKGQYNSFGKYKYRSCEDIVQAVNQEISEGFYLNLSDEIIMLGDRFYIKATASIHSESDSISVNAFAREPEEKKGMDASQITGAASSYARKYALNGLLAIDDIKDADTRPPSENTTLFDEIVSVLKLKTNGFENKELLNSILKSIGVSNSAEIQKMRNKEKRDILEKIRGRDLMAEYADDLRGTIDQDFPIPEDEKEIGSPNYRCQYGKFRGDKLCDIDIDQMEKYIEWLDGSKKLSDGLKEVHESMVKYRTNMEIL